MTVWILNAVVRSWVFSFKEQGGKKMFICAHWLYFVMFNKSKLKPHIPFFFFLDHLAKPRSADGHVGAHAQTRSQIPGAQRGKLSRFGFWRSDSSCLKDKTAVLYSTLSWAARRRNEVGKKGESREREKAKTKVRNRVAAARTRHICLWMCAPTGEGESVWEPWVCYRHNPDFS